MRNAARWIVTLIVAGMVSGSVPPLDAQGPSSVRPWLIPTAVQGQIVNPGAIAPGLESEAHVTVVATLTGDPVALEQHAAGRRLSRTEKDRVKALRRGEQAAVRPSIEALGAEVLGAYQSALNGFKVRIARRQLAALRQVPGVVAVKHVPIYYPASAVGGLRIEAPIAWDAPAGLRGEGVKIAVIDSGIDYTHANFGGPGTAAAYAKAAAGSTQDADPSLFGPAAPKVKGGYDLVGDDYDPWSDDPARRPRPDSNPLDCQAGGGHGTIVSGPLAGFGVTDTGTTYTGPYDRTTHTFPFRIGPGVAPKADLYAVRVYGCDGGFSGTAMITEAIEWAIEHDMDVINMSLGNRFAVDLAEDAVSEAADNAVRAGIVVAAVAGNEGSGLYLTRSPGASTRSVSVASSIAAASYPAATVAAGGSARLIQNSNGAPFSGATYHVHVLRDASGGISFGCKPNTGSPDDWALPVNGANVAGKLVIVQRGGTCARIARAVYGEQHGAAAVLLINFDDAFPPFEGPITLNPDDGSAVSVTIPFFGARLFDAAPLQALGSQAAHFTPSVIATGLSEFSSAGPRNGDGLLKPDITAPGSSIVTALVGSGNGSFTASGTSLATPMVAGVAALILQAHPAWKPWQVKAAIINSGRPSELSDYLARRAGSGLVSAASATRTSTIAFADTQTTTLNFGVQEFSVDFRGSEPIFLENDSGQDVSFDVSVTHQSGSPHTLSMSRTHVRVPARGRAQVIARLIIPAATAGDATEFRDVAGLVTFTPATPSDNGGSTLRVPYYAVPRVSADVTAGGKPAGLGKAAAVRLDNRSAAIAGTADFFAWGLASSKDATLPGHIDIRAAGVQSLANGEIVVFAINTRAPWSTAAAQQFDVLIDSNLDGIEDFGVVSFDYGRGTTGVHDGRVGTFVIDFTSGAFSTYFLAYAPTDGSSILLPVPAAAIGITPDNPRFAYTVASWTFWFDQTDNTYESWAFFNPFTNAISTGAFAIVNPRHQVDVPVTVNPTEWERTPALGLMIVSPDNPNGSAEASLVKIRVQ
jgi:subtilisin family serine protease